VVTAVVGSLLESVVSLDDLITHSSGVDAVGRSVLVARKAQAATAILKAIETKRNIKASTITVRHLEELFKLIVTKILRMLPNFIPEEKIAVFTAELENELQNWKTELQDRVDNAAPEKVVHVGSK
jgi:hypothetical protein